MEIMLDSEGVHPQVLEWINQGLYEQHEELFAATYLKPTDKVLELGCAIGFVSVCTKAKMPEIHWEGYDANPWCVEKAKKNSAINNQTNAVFHNTLVLVEPTQATEKFYCREDFLASSMDPTVGTHSKITEVVDVPIIDFNDIIKDKTALLVDIEGAEKFLFNDESKANIDHINTIIISIHPNIGVDGVKNVLRFLTKTHRMENFAGDLRLEVVVVFIKN